MTLSIGTVKQSDAIQRHPTIMSTPPASPSVPPSLPPQPSSAPAAAGPAAAVAADALPEAANGSVVTPTTNAADPAAAAAASADPPRGGIGPEDSSSHQDNHSAIVANDGGDVKKPSCSMPDSDSVQAEGGVVRGAASQHLASTHPGCDNVAKAAAPGFCANDAGCDVEDCCQVAVHDVSFMSSYDMSLFMTGS